MRNASRIGLVLFLVLSVGCAAPYPFGRTPFLIVDTTKRFKHSAGFSYLAENEWVEVARTDDSVLFQAPWSILYSISFYEAAACAEKNDEQQILDCFIRRKTLWYTIMGKEAEFKGSSIVSFENGTGYALAYVDRTIPDDRIDHAAETTVYLLPSKGRGCFAVTCTALGQERIPDRVLGSFVELVESLRVD